MNVINGYNSRAPARDVKGGEDSGIRIPRRAEFTPNPRYTRKRSVFTDRSYTAHQPPAPQESSKRVYIDSHHHSIGTSWNPPSAAEQRREPVQSARPFPVAEQRRKSTAPLPTAEPQQIPSIRIQSPQSTESMPSSESDPTTPTRPPSRAAAHTTTPSTTATITSAATTATAAMATRLEPVERFDGSQNARRWMGRFKRQERAAGSDSESWIEAFDLLMEGPAIKWAEKALKQWLNNPSDEAVGCITSAFLKKWEVDETDTDVSAAIELLLNISQGTTEPLKDYHERASILLQEAELQDSSDQAGNTGGMLIAAINRFKKGLHNRELRSLVNKEPATKTLRSTLTLLGKPVPAELALRVGAITNTTAKKVAFKQVNYAEASSETFPPQYHQPYPQQSNYHYPQTQYQQQQQRYTSPPPPRSQSQSLWHQPPRQTTPVQPQYQQQRQSTPQAPQHQQQQWQPNQGPKLYDPQRAQVVSREIGQNLPYSNNNNLSRQNP
ncbi:unnamed protein product [Zymoseptoria tritici ST99CH_1E4]|uniref:Uncharacterized protein n=1 Tax=Zymoseptoria tritici ST99CH_1E4 TaxID=1276532 RepID=A0A2H1H9E9_ZYMTR|nr:unnamed protein product [Zymoseptoria tritici ST99CH_1E4]